MSSFALRIQPKSRRIIIARRKQAFSATIYCESSKCNADIFRVIRAVVLAMCFWKLFEVFIYQHIKFFAFQALVFL